MIYADTFSFINQVLIFAFIQIFCVQIYFINIWLFFYTFVFPDPELPIINILYGWSGIYGQFLLCAVLFSLTISSKFIIYTLRNNKCFKHVHCKQLVFLNTYFTKHFTFTYFKSICSIWMCCNSIKCLKSFIITTI